MTEAVKIGADYENFRKAQNLIEAILFMSGHPIKEKRLVEGLGLDKQIVSEALKVLAKEMEDRGIRLVNNLKGWELVTDHEIGHRIAEFFNFQRKRRLSHSAMETLSVIGYHQPITRKEIDALRGVDSSYIVKSLLERDLIRIAGQRETPGMPYEFGVSETFLHHFGLDSVDELPKLQIDFDRESKQIEGLTVEAADLGIGHTGAVTTKSSSEVG